MTCRSADTRRLYAWEETFVDRIDRQLRPIAELRALGERIWKENTRRRDRCPVIVAGAGWWNGETHLSYCQGRARIVLARHMRTRRVLIHEMVHALGPETHGKRFQERYADLLGRYL